MTTAAMTTAADVLRSRAGSEALALRFEDRSWTYRDLVGEANRRAALFAELSDQARPPHIGVLLDNVPDYPFWLAAAALSGTVVVGINSTYRGEQLAQLIRHTDCQVLVTSTEQLQLLGAVGSNGASRLDTGVDPERVLLVDSDEYARRIGEMPPEPVPWEVAEGDLFLLIFTSGSTGLPKAVRCTQGRYARTGAHVARVAELAEGDVVYSSLPFFHASALFTGWASAMTVGVAIATRRRFSGSGTLADVRRFGATMLTYTGKVLNYMLATPEQPDDKDCPLRLAIGNEASARDIKEFSRRFGCTVRDSYGSTEGIIIIRRDPSMPEGALGRSDPSVKVLDPRTGAERPPATFDAEGRPVNLEEATGEIVETQPSAGFEGYYKHEEATRARFRGGWYWSGDLAYRDGEGGLFFAGRSNDWLRVDGENFAAAPVEAIISRHPDVRAVSVYAVPDDPVGDRVMAALELVAGARLHPAELDEFLDEQPDLGTKWRPAFVRVTEELPKLASMKIDKLRLRREAWRAGSVFWRPSKGEALRPLDDEARARLDRLLT